jgi:hypothetical protein
MDLVWPYVQRISLCLGISLLGVHSGLSQERTLETETAPLAKAQDTVAIERGTFLQVELAQRADWKHLARNSHVDGRLMLPVFAGREMVMPTGTKIELTIDSVKKANDNAGKWKKAGNAVVRAFNPMEKKPAEYAIQLSKTEIEGPQGRMEIAATALRAARTVMIEPRREKVSSAAKSHQTVLLELDQELRWPAAAGRPVNSADGIEERKARAFLLTQLSASHSHKDDLFQARLAEPVSFGHQWFAAGSLLEGKVSRSTPPRMLSRAGTLYLRIERITSPSGVSVGSSGTLAGVEADRSTKYALDEEGGLHGLKPGVKNALVDLSIAYALGKLTDDLAEAPIRAVGAAMSNAAAANAARYFGLGASAVFLVTRHGRDVNLPKYSEIEIDLGRFGEDVSALANSRR